MTNPFIPQGLAIIVCDAVHTDPFNEKRTILGAFSYLTVDEYPLTFKKLTVHLSLTGCQGEYDILLKITDAGLDAEIVAAYALSVEASSPIDVVSIDASLPDVTIPKPGDYFFEIYYQDHQILARRIFFRRFGGDQP